MKQQCGRGKDSQHSYLLYFCCICHISIEFPRIKVSLRNEGKRWRNCCCALGFILTFSAPSLNAEAADRAEFLPAAQKGGAEGGQQHIPS